MTLAPSNEQSTLRTIVARGKGFFQAGAGLTPLVWNLTAAVLGQGATLAMTTGLARALAPTEFGIFSTASGTVLSLSALAQFGLAFTALNFVARYATTDPGKATSIAGFCLAMGAIVGTLLGIGIALGAWPLAAGLYDEGRLFPVFLIAAAGIPAATIGLVETSVMIGLQRFKLLAINALVYAVFALSGSFAGVMIGGAQGAAIGYVLAVNVRALHLYIQLKHQLPQLRWRQRLDEMTAGIRDLAPFLFPAGLTSLTVTPVIWLSNAWLVNARGLHELGLFAVAFTIKTLVVFVPVQIGTVFLPRYVALGATDPAGANLHLGRIMMIVTVFSVCAAALFGIFAPWLLSWFGGEFATGALALRLLLATVVMESVATIGAYRFAGERRMWTLLLAYTLPRDCLLIAAAFVFAPQFGAAGLAGAHLVAWSYAAMMVAGLALRGHARLS